MYSIILHTIKEEEFKNFELATAAILANWLQNSNTIDLKNVLPPEGGNTDINCGNIKVKMPTTLSTEVHR